MPKKDPIDPDELLREATERQIGVSLPIAISEKLDRLVLLAREEGLRVYRKDLLAALVLVADEDSKDLASIVLRFGRAKSRDAMAADREKEKVVRLDRPKPGRRPRRA